MSSSKILTALREKLKHENLNGLIVPHGDEFQNEFLPPDSKRLCYITGVDTSAGLAIILMEQAALFVDGRYLLAAKEAVNPELFSVLSWSSENVQKFLEGHLKKKMTLGVDPWTLTAQDMEGFKNISKVLDIHLTSLSFNPIDVIWEERPHPSLKEAFLWPDHYAGESTLSKRVRISETLKKKGADAFYIGLPESLNWLLNIRGKDTLFTPILLATGILYKDARLDVFTNLEKIPSSFSSHFGPTVQFLEKDQLEKSLSMLSKMVQKIWYDPHSTPDAILELRGLKKESLFAQKDPCLFAKAVKNPTEILGMQHAHQRDGLAVVRFLSWLEDEKNGLHTISETKAAQKLTSFREQLPLYHSLSFDVISAMGSNGAIIHYHAKEGQDKTLACGDLYLVDSGGQYLDGTTDITRTILLRKSSSLPEMKEAFTRVLKGHIALASVKFPKGTTGGQLDVLARQFLWEKGLNYSHGTGHGVGAFLSVHQSPPSISQRPTASAPLDLGMIVSNEPGYYKEDAFGIRIESLLLVKPSEVEGFYQFETLTLVPIDKKLILEELLTVAEKDWINLYHNTVFESLAPDLNPTEKQWLKEATEAL